MHRYATTVGGSCLLVQNLYRYCPGHYVSGVVVFGLGFGRCCMVFGGSRLSRACVLSLIRQVPLDKRVWVSDTAFMTTNEYRLTPTDEAAITARIRESFLLWEKPIVTPNVIDALERV